MGPVCGFYSNCLVIILLIISMKCNSLFLCFVIGLAAAKREILRRHGDYFLRLGNDNGRLVLDEGDILPMDTPLEAPMQYKRSKRIAHVKDYEKYVTEKDKYLCEISATSKQNLLMEETALLAMIQSQSDISSILNANLVESQGIRRLRRSAKSIDAALQEAAHVGQFCHKRFPDCKISRIDILKVYKEQKESFCSLPMPYGM